MFKKKQIYCLPKEVLLAANEFCWPPNLPFTTLFWYRARYLNRGVAFGREFTPDRSIFGV